MTRPREANYTTNFSLFQEKKPLLSSDRFEVNPIPSPDHPAHSHLQAPNQYTVYLWVSKNDHLPFYIGIGSEFQAYEMTHKKSGGQLAAHQFYRNIVGKDFICLFLDKHLTEIYAHSLFHYAYHYYKGTHSLAPPLDPSNTDVFLTMKEPSWLQPDAGDYTVVRPLTPLPHSTPEQLRAREFWKRELLQKLKMQRHNRASYNRYTEEKLEAKAKMKNLDSLPVDQIPKPPVR